MNRASRRAAGERRWTPATSYPPSPKQRDYIRTLSAQLEIPPKIPRSKQQASAHIKNLLALKRRQRETKPRKKK